MIISLALEKLKKVPVFVNWKYEKKVNGDLTKPPVDPRNTQKYGNISDPTVLVDYKTAKKNVAAGLCNGIGIVLNDCSKVTGYENYTLVGIDIDSHQCDKNQYFDDIYSLFNGAYCEISPSGDGFHFLFMVKKEAIPANYKSVYFEKNSEKEIECYVGGMTTRYLTLTCNSVAPYLEDLIEDRTDEWLKFLDVYMKREKVLPNATISEANLSIYEGLEILRKSKNGELFSKLYDVGDASDFPSESEARMRLCGMLAFALGKDYEKVLEAYKSSALYQQRPDKAHDIGCVAKAIASCTSVYTKKINAPSSVTTCDQNIKVEDYICLTYKSILQKIIEIDPDNNTLYKEWSDVSNARLFIAIVKKEVCYVPEEQSWFVYDGVRWQEDLNNLKVKKLMQYVAEAIKEYFEKNVIPKFAKNLDLTQADDTDKYSNFKKGKKKIYDSWLSLVKRKLYLEDAQSLNVVPYAKFDDDNHIFNVKNGTIHLLKDGSFRFKKHDPKDFCTQCSDVTYNPNIYFDRWHSFIEEVMEGKSDKIKFLQKIFGYCLSGDTNHECFFIFLGTATRNGKSTLLYATQTVYGSYGTAGNAATIMQRNNNNSSGPSEDLARLKGIRFLNIPEPEKDFRLDVAVVKRMTGNDPINARFLHKNSFVYSPKFKFILATNHEPLVTDSTLFSSDRVWVVTFDKFFSEEERDTELKTVLTSEEAQSGILNWMLEGWKLLKEEGLAVPKVVKEATENYAKSQDRIGQFIEECFEKKIGEFTRVVDAFNAYNSYMFQNNYKALGKSKWKKEMELAGVKFDEHRPRSYEPATTVICNMKLKPEYTQSYNEDGFPY